MFRLQLQGELQSKKQAPRLYKGVFHGVKVILQNEGPKGFFRGIGAAVSRVQRMTPFTWADMASMSIKWS